MKSKILRHLSERWFIYLIWAAVAVFLSEWIFSLITAPDESERITVFIGAYSCDTVGLSEKLDEEKPDNVREIRVEYYDIDNYNFQMFFTVKSAEADLFVLPKKVVDDANLLRFCEFSREKALSLFGVGDVLDYGGYGYGLKIYDGADNEGSAGKYVGYAEDGKTDDYYILFNRQSVHAGGLNSGESDGAIVLARRLLRL